MEDAIEMETSPRKRPRLIEEATEDVIVDAVGNTIQEGTSHRRPPGPIEEAIKKYPSPKKPSRLVEEAFGKNPSPSKRPRLMDGATSKELRPKKRPGRKKHQMIDILSGTTADPLPLPTTDSAIESPQNGLEITSSINSQGSRPHGYLETELHPTSGGEGLFEAATGPSTIVAEQGSQDDTSTSPLTSVPSSAEDGPFGSTYNEAAQPASPENNEDQSESVQNRRVAQLKTGPKRVEKKRPRRSAYGLRSGRKEVMDDD